MEQQVALLRCHMPAEAAPLIYQWILDAPCEFVISRSRRSKFGDYRAPYRGRGHRISVNHDLNPFAFLITTVHEFAHLKTWESHKARVKPHGEVWKSNFRVLMEPFFRMGLFPADIEQAVQQYLSNPGASSCSDLNLFRTLQRYDKRADHLTVLEELPEKAVFAIASGRVFEKGEKLRKRYRCHEKASGRTYLFNPLAEVEVIARN